MKSPTQENQLLLQRAINQRPELLRAALRESGAVGRREDVTWHSPLAIIRCSSHSVNLEPRCEPWHD